MQRKGDSGRRLYESRRRAARAVAQPHPSWHRLRTLWASGGAAAVDDRGAHVEPYEDDRTSVALSPLRAEATTVAGILHG